MRLCTAQAYGRMSCISIHASRMGCDAKATQPAGNVQISIHASRMGCDLCRTFNSIPTAYFNPRIPYGMRPIRADTTPEVSAFQSTHPVWDATQDSRLYVAATVISIHASRMGCDFCWPLLPLLLNNFNPRIPYGMRLAKSVWMPKLGKFQSTHPVWDATPAYDKRKAAIIISIHASRMGCDSAGT